MTKFKVYDCSDCSINNLTPTIVENAKIELYKEINNEKVKFQELFSDANGEVVFYGDRTETYFAIISHDKATSTKDGYLMIGVAQDENEVSYYRGYYLPNLEIGDIIYMDLNGDGLLDVQDKSAYIYVYYSEGRELLQEVYISE